MDTARVIICRL